MIHMIAHTFTGNLTEKMQLVVTVGVSPLPPESARMVFPFVLEAARPFDEPYFRLVISWAYPEPGLAVASGGAQPKRLLLFLADVTIDEVLRLLCENMKQDGARRLLAEIPRRMEWRLRTFVERLVEMTIGRQLVVARS